MTAFTTSRIAARQAKTRRRRGLTLFGVLMGLGIAAAVTVGVVVLYNTATEALNKGRAQSLLTSLVVAVQQIHQGSSDYGTTSTDIVPMLALRNAIPSNARTGNTIVHPFGDAVTVTGSGTTANGRFIVTFEGLERPHCALLLDPFIGQSRAGGSLWGVKVGTRTAVVPPLTATNIGTECNGGITATGTGDVELEFE